MSTIHAEVKSHIAAQGYTLTQIVQEMNKSRPPDKQTTVQNISNKLTRGTIKYSEIIEIAEIIGLCVRRSAKSPRPAELSSGSAEIEQWDRPD